MFITQENNALPLHSFFAGDGTTIWSAIEFFNPGDTLLVQFSDSSRHTIRRLVMLDLIGATQTLKQISSQGGVVRGVAVLRTKRDKSISHWVLEPIQEISVRSGPSIKGDDGAIAVTTFTTTEGRSFSMFGGATTVTKKQRIYKARGRAAISERLSN